MAAMMAGKFVPVARLGCRHRLNRRQMSGRRPTVRDLVKLHPSLDVESLKDLRKEQVATVTQDQAATDPVTPYQVRWATADGTFTSPWFEEGDLVLADPLAPWPKPEVPENCCGSQCPNCVWVQYQQECDEWIRVTGGTI
jgi:hypothetical protein